MAAGILLGPSLLGWIAPGVYQYLFPANSLGFVNALSQFGLVLFMFLVGVEVDLKVLRGRSATALLVSPISILLPFGLGMGLAGLLYPQLSPPDVPFLVFSLFIGAAMSITAFPVLARILSERKLLRTELGVVAIACAALDDISGWLILAFVLVLARAGESSLPLWGILIGVAVYGTLMLFPLRRLMQRVENLFIQRQALTPDLLAFVLLFALASAWTTEAIGIHALFGAFMSGVVMPRLPGFAHALDEKLNDVVVVVFLPLFFAYTGLRMNVGMLNGVQMWLFCGLILLTAVAGKFIGGMLPARWTGMRWREAAALGALLNTRGLIELVLLNIGLDIGLITPTLFTMLVIMALVTTLMTSPVVEWVYFRRLAPAGEYPAPADEIQEPKSVTVIVGAKQAGKD